MKSTMKTLMAAITAVLTLSSLANAQFDPSVRSATPTCWAGGSIRPLGPVEVDPWGRIVPERRDGGLDWRDGSWGWRDGIRGGGFYPPSSYPPSYPSYPVVVTPDRFTGYNPSTGGWNTGNSQINNTAFDPYRDMSRYNGTQRWESRPVYDSYGRVIGYQEGTVWNNSVTGTEHSDMISRTPNGFGGTHEQAIATRLAIPGTQTAQEGSDR